MGRHKKNNFLGRHYKITTTFWKNITKIRLLAVSTILKRHNKQLFTFWEDIKKNYQLFWEDMIKIGLSAVPTILKRQRKNIINLPTLREDMIQKIMGKI